MTTQDAKKKFENFVFCDATQDELHEYAEYLRESIREEYKLDSKFVKFMQLRFPLELSPSYIDEWAQRVKSGVHFGCADKISKKALIEAGYTE